MKPSTLNDRLAKWAILLSQYEMQFLPQKAVKGQAVADFLVEHPDPRTIKLYEDFSDEIAEVCMTQTSFKEQVCNSSSTAHQKWVLDEISYLEWG